MKFLPYQIRWIQDDSPLKLYEKTRRGGITFATSYRTVIKCLRRGAPFVQWVSSRDEITAREFVTDYVARWVKMANHSAVGLDGCNVEVVDEKKGLTAQVVKFCNGARIYSLSSNPLAFAGKGGDVLIDEWDLHPDQAAVYDMAYPCITWGGQLELVSAYDPSGSDATEFARLCRECRNGTRPNISFHRTTIMDAIEEGFVKTLNECRTAKGMKTCTEAEFLQELKNGCRSREAFESQYLCIPNHTGGQQLIRSSDLAKAVFDLKTIRVHFPSEEPDSIYADAAFWTELFHDCPCAFGFDIARNGDLSSIWINKLTGSYAELLALITFHNCRFQFQKEIVHAILQTGQAIGCGDKTGMGMAICEELEEMYQDQFYGINFASSKLMLGTQMQNIFEAGLQRLPSGMPDITADLAGIQKISGTGGRLHLAERKNPLLPDSHCDLAWSCALAIQAAGRSSNVEEGACFAESMPDFQQDERNREERL